MAGLNDRCVCSTGKFDIRKQFSDKLKKHEEEGPEEKYVGVLQDYPGENEFQQKAFQEGV